MTQQADTLLVLDVQEGAVAAFPEIWADVLDRIVGLLHDARSAGAATVFVQHDGPPGHPFEVGTPGWEVARALDVGDAAVVRKRWSDAFAGTTLRDVLRELGATRLAVTGLQTELCVDSTTRRAASEGFDVVLVADAHTTVDSPTLRRQEVIAHHNDALARLAVDGPVVAVVPADEVRFVAPPSRRRS